MATARITDQTPAHTDSPGAAPETGNAAQAPAAFDPPAARMAPVRAPAPEQPRLWLYRRDQLVLAVLSLAVLALLAAHWVRLSHWGLRSVDVERLPARSAEYRIDINAATWVEWSQLDGIGDALSRRIVGDRDENGPFRSIDDLRRVKGIGPKTLERIRPWLTFDPQTARTAVGGK